MLIKAQNLGIKGQDDWRVRGVSLTINAGEIVTMIGPNGSGKTTTAKALLGIIPADEGTIERKPHMRIGYVPQSLQVSRNVPMSTNRFLQLTHAHSDEDIGQALSLVGLGVIRNKPVSELSGGQLQRALIARALLLKPDLMVLDEPVQGVDFSGEIALYELITQIRDKLGCGMLLISHDLAVIRQIADRVAVMYHGKLVEEGSTAQVFEAPHQDYTRSLLAAIPGANAA